MLVEQFSQNVLRETSNSTWLSSPQHPDLCGDDDSPTLISLPSFVTERCFYSEREAVRPARRTAPRSCPYVGSSLGQGDAGESCGMGLQRGALKQGQRTGRGSRGLLSSRRFCGEDAAPARPLASQGSARGSTAVGNLLVLMSSTSVLSLNIKAL